MGDLTMGQFREVARSGGFRVVGVTAGGPTFFITAITKTDEVVMLNATRCKRARLFRHPSPAIALLRGMGVLKLEVDMTRWYEADRPRQVRRPDVAARLRRAHGSGGHA